MKKTALRAILRRPTRWCALIAAAAVALGWGVGAAAAGKPPVDRTGKYIWVDTATVAAVDPAAHSFSATDSYGDAIYHVDDDTMIRKGSETIPLDQLARGDRVAISAHAGIDGSDRIVADTVTIVILDPETGKPSRRPVP